MAPSRGSCAGDRESGTCVSDRKGVVNLAAPRSPVAPHRSLSAKDFIPVSETTPVVETREQRRSQRFALPGDPPITATARGQSYVCHIENLSIHGLGLRFDRQTPSGDIIVIDHPVVGTFCGRSVWRKNQSMGVDIHYPRGEMERVLKCIGLVLEHQST